jgi:hypothetical protein
MWLTHIFWMFLVWGGADLKGRISAEQLQTLPYSQYDEAWHEEPMPCLEISNNESSNPQHASWLSMWLSARATKALQMDSCSCWRFHCQLHCNLFTPLVLLWDASWGTLHGKLLLLASRCPGTAKACWRSLDQLINIVTYLELLQFAFKQRRPPYTWKTQHTEQKENGRRGLLSATWNSTCKLQGLHSRTQLANDP